MSVQEHDKRKCPEHISTTECTRQLLPVQDALDVLAGKWKLQIILSLTFGKKRFKQIQRELPGLTPKMLSKELKDLEMNDLAVRHVYDSIPVMVEYELTPYGKTLKPLIQELHAWDNAYEPKTDGAPILTDDRTPVDLWSERINWVARKDLHEYFAKDGTSW